MLQSEWNPVERGPGDAPAPSPRLLVRPLGLVVAMGCVGLAATLELALAFALSL